MWGGGVCASCLKKLSLDRDNGTFNRDVVERVGHLAATAQPWALRWPKDPQSKLREVALFSPLFCWKSYLVDFLENEIVRFDENLAVVL